MSWAGAVPAAFPIPVGHCRFRLEFQCLARCNPYPTRVPLWLESPLRPSHTVIPIWSPPLLALLLQSSPLLL